MCERERVCLFKGPKINVRHEFAMCVQRLSHKFPTLFPGSYQLHVHINTQREIRERENVRDRARDYERDRQRKRERKRDRKKERYIVF